MRGSRVLRLPIALLAATLLAAMACGGSSSDPAGPGAPPAENDGIATIGPEGGEVRLGSRAGVIVPAGALDDPVTISVSESPTTAVLLEAGAVGQAFRFAPAGLRFRLPVEVFLRVSDEALAGAAIDRVVLVSTAAAGEGVEELEVLARRSLAGGTEVHARAHHFSVLSAAVPPAKEPPVADAGPDREARVGETVELSGDGSDPDGGEVTLEWSLGSRPEGSDPSLENGGTATPSFSAGVSGTFELVLTVTDDEGESATDTAVVVVVDNRPPVADAGPDRSGEAGDTFSLDGTGSSDPDGDALAFAWTFASSPGDAPPLDGADSAEPSFTAPEDGVYELELEVTDPAGASDTDRTRVVVGQEGNAAPSADAGDDRTVVVDSEVTLNGSRSSDPDGDPLAFLWELLRVPDGSEATLSGADGPRPTFLADRTGTYAVQLEVDDGRGGTDDDTVRIFVEPPPNLAPTGSLTGPDQVMEGATVTVEGSWSDPEDDPVTVTWELETPEGSGATLAVDGSTATFDADVNGTYLVRMRLDDGENVTVVEKEVGAYPDVAGVYTTEATLDEAGLLCPEEVRDSVGNSDVADMTVEQPEPDTVIPDLVSAIDGVKENPVMTLSPDGTATYDGTILVEDEDGNQYTADLRMTLVFDDDGGFTGEYAITISGCTIEGTLRSPP
ncbi:MAG: PKD domain-containing protein [Gemmatimonadota bacterium]|nr:PKD domain-containing protein [Gemmatimonadota bacterium]